ncbi:MAG: hypothetical protein R3Y59_02905 [bacterium]
MIYWKRSKKGKAWDAKNKKEQAEQKAMLEIKRFEAKRTKQIFINMDGKMLQMLESADILLTTKNIDTFLGRYDFIAELSNELKYVVDNFAYRHYISIAVDNYKEMYYDRMLSNEQIAFIVNPNAILLDNTFGSLLYNCVARYCDKMDLEMINLKTDKAKQRRLGAIGDTASLIAPYINNPERRQWADKIENMINNSFNIDYVIISRDLLKLEN